MNISYDYRVYKKYLQNVNYNHIRAINKITDVIIHGTGGGDSAKGVINWMLSGQYESDYVRGIRLFHYLIDRNGDIYSIISKLYKVFHSSSGAHDEFTIGIEMVNPAMENQGEYTREQYTSLLSLIDYIRLECNIKTIAGHGATKAKYSSGYKSCPGQFNWAFLEQNYKLNKIQTETYEIIS